MRRALLPALAFALVLGSPDSAALPAQARPDLDTLLDRLATYLLAYELQLATIIAEERYEQSEYRAVTRSGWHRQRHRRLESDVAFLRLPDNSAWFGVREVRVVDGKPVGEGKPQLEAILKRLGPVAVDEAAQIVARSAAYNIGGLRTINMPTVPLEMLHPNNHVRFVFKTARGERIDGAETSRLDLEEIDEPTIILGTDNAPVFTSGSAWIETASGALRRAELTMSIRRVRGGRPERINQLAVHFVPNVPLKMLVPREMRETFWIPGGRGEGRAVYSQFRQFTTSARIVPQP